MIIIKKPFNWIFSSLFIHSLFLFYIISYQQKPHIPQVVKPLEAINIEFVKSDTLVKKSVAKHNNSFVKITHTTKPSPPNVKIIPKIVKKIAATPKPVPQKKTIPQKIAIVRKPVIQKNIPPVDSIVTGSINSQIAPINSASIQKTPSNDFGNNTAVKAQAQKQITNSQGNTGATAMYQPKAKYTLAMLRKRMKGVVSVQLFFDVHGKVSDYKIIKSTRYKLLNQAVVSACRQYRIKPPQKAGKAIKYTDTCVQEMIYN